MPVVRELVNRIGFKINRGELADAENAFKKLTTRAAIGLTGIQIAATKTFVDFKKDTADVNFFANNKEEAEAILKLTNEIAEASETTSRREARAAAKTISTFNVNKKLLEEILPFIEKISIARPNLDFTDVVSSLEDVIKGGNIQALLDLVPGIKDELEILSKTNFQTPFADITEEQRAELLIKTLRENRARLTELVAEQKTQIPFFVERVSKESSDFFLNFGEKTAPAMMVLLELISTTIKEINENEAFWEAIATSADAIAKAFLLTKQAIIDINKMGILGFAKETLDVSDEERAELGKQFKEEGEKIQEQRGVLSEEQEKAIIEAGVTGLIVRVFDSAKSIFDVSEEEREELGKQFKEEGEKIREQITDDPEDIKINKDQGIDDGSGLLKKAKDFFKETFDFEIPSFNIFGNDQEDTKINKNQVIDDDSDNIAPILEPIEQEKVDSIIDPNEPENKTVSEIIIEQPVIKPTDESKNDKSNNKSINETINKTEQSINISGEILLKGENVTGINLAKMESVITKKIVDMYTTAHDNITVSNGGLAQVST